MLEMWKIEKIREVCALLILAVSAYTDIKERNIYIMPLVIGAISAMSLSIISFINTPCGELTKQVFSEIISPLLAAGFVILITYMLRDNIGVGDGYLFAMLFLMIGVVRNVRLICVASIFVGIFGAIVMMIRLDKVYKRIPFAPFMMAGFITIMI